MRDRVKSGHGIKKDVTRTRSTLHLPLNRLFAGHILTAEFQFVHIVYAWKLWAFNQCAVIIWEHYWQPIHANGKKVISGIALAPEVKERRVTLFSPLLANTKSQHASFVAYDCSDWITTEEACKISSIRRLEPGYPFEYTLAASHGLFEEDGAFWFYVSTCQVNASNTIYCVVRTHARRLVGRGFHCFPYLAHILY